MKLSTLYEVRDPKKEVELEPYLTAPFRDQPERARAGRAQAAAYRKKYGMPDPQFLPAAPKGNEGPGYRQDPDLMSGGPYFRDIGIAKDIPVQRWGSGSVKPETNIADVGKHLTQALHYWAKNFDGKRWPALEQAFINRNWTFKGGIGVYNKARMALFTYLNKLKESWPEGEAMADTVLNSKNAWDYLTHYYHKGDAIQQYALRRPRNPEFVSKMKAIIGDPETSEFHVDDVFARYLQTYDNKTLEFFRQYINKPNPKAEEEAEAFKNRMKELEERPPFAGWA